MSTNPTPIIPDYCQCGQHVDLHDDELHSARIDGLRPRSRGVPFAADEERHDAEARDFAVYSVMAFQDMWHAAADAIELAAAADVDADWMLALASVIREEAGPQDSLVSLNITILFDDQKQADVARRHVRRAVDERDRNA